jgi:hypothetical protein
MRARRLPPPAPSSSTSAPPRSGSGRRPALCSLTLLFAVLGPLTPAADAQQLAASFAIDSYDPYSGTRSSLWLGTTPGLYRPHPVASGVGFGLAISNAPYSAGSFSTWVSHRRPGFHRGWKRKKPHRIAYWGVSCWDALWDPYFWYWPGCAPGWGVAGAWGYAGYPTYPVHYPAYPVSPVHGWSVGIHLSFGNYWGSSHRGWRSYDPWSRWDRYAWYGPPTRSSWRTIYVDPYVNRGPRWRVSPAARSPRVAFSPEIGSGGWVSQARFKENPRQAGVPVRTAVARSRGDAAASAPTTREAVGANRAQTSGARRPTVIRGTESGSAARAPREQTASRARPGQRAAPSSGATSARPQPAARRAEPRALARPDTRTARDARSQPARTQPSRAPLTRSEPSRATAERSEPARSRPSRSSAARSAPDRATAPRPSPPRASARDERVERSGRASGARARSQSPQASGRAAAPPRASRGAGGQPRASQPRSAPRASAPRASAPRASAPRSSAPRASGAPSRGSSRATAPRSSSRR